MVQVLLCCRFDVSILVTAPTSACWDARRTGMVVWSGTLVVSSLIAIGRTSWRNQVWLLTGLAVSGFGIWSGPPTGGWANVALTGDVAAPNQEWGSPQTPPPTAAGLCSACDVNGKGGTPGVLDWEVKVVIKKLAPLRQIIGQDQTLCKLSQTILLLLCFYWFKSLHSSWEDGILI